MNLPKSAFGLVALAAIACGPAPRNEPAVVVPVVVPPPPPPTASGTGDPTPAPAAVDALQQGTTTVVVKVDRAASRQPESPRTLRRLLAARQGQLELARGYTRVSFIVSSVESGTLDDPDYAKRPIGVNVLPVVLLDDAAFAAHDSMEGFEGRWKLTRRPDGTLVVASIADTPYPPQKADERRAAHDRARAALRGATPEERLAGIDDLEKHIFLDLVPDLIALLDDTRAEQPKPQPRGSHVIRLPRVVREAAERRLQGLLTPFGVEALPKGPDRRAWESFWQELVSRKDDGPPAIAPSTIVERLPISSSQSSANVAATPDGVLFYGVSRLATPLEGHVAGLALGRPGEKRVWIGNTEREGLDVVSGPAGIAAVHAGWDGAWTVTTAARDLAAPKSTTLAPDSSHCAIAASPTGFGFVFTKKGASSFFALSLDPSGKPRGAPKEIKLPEQPEVDYHRGVHPIGLARKSNGWLVTIEASSSVLVVALDDAFSTTATTALAPRGGIAQPRLAVGKDRALVVWTRDGLGSNTSLAHATVDLSGQKISGIGTTGSEVQAFSHPIALPEGGFALAWIEASSEVHLAKLDANGERVANVILQAREALQDPIALARDARGFVVASVDTSRFPYSLLVRRVDPAVVK